MKASRSRGKKDLISLHYITSLHHTEIISLHQANETFLKATTYCAKKEKQQLTGVNF
jgi:hypothetical protein